MSRADLASEVSMLPRVIEVEVRVIAPGIVSHPLIIAPVTVNVRSCRMSRLILISSLRLVLLIALLTTLVVPG